MKKIIAMTAFLMLFAGAAMAADSTAGATGTTATGNQTLQATAPSSAAIAKMSKNVGFGWNTSATGYSLETFHSNGTKAYGTGYDSTRIYFQDATAVAAPSSSLASEAFAGWTAM